MSAAPRAPALPDFVLRQFNRGDLEPDHRQLFHILQRGIRQSVLKPGTKLPPTRTLAQALRIARNTVIHVYEQLALEGYVQANVGRGTYVAEVGPRLVARAVRVTALAMRRSRLSRRGERTISEAGNSRLQWGAFMPGVPEVRMFPMQVWSRLHAGVCRNVTPQQMTYATWQGDQGLREAVAEYLQSTRGVICGAEQVVITSGTQQSIYLISQLLADPGDTVWLEDPGYWGARSVFRAGGLDVKPIAVDEDGLAPTAEQLREPPRLMFVSPSHQMPTGAVMSHGRRQQMLEYAAANRVWIVEDDYDGEFRYGAQPLPSLQGLDQHGRVIYLGTFSKTMFPSLRIAYLVLPPDLVEGFARVLSELFREGQTIQQAVLTRFINEGHYALHIRRMRTLYSARREALIHEIRRTFGPQLGVVGGDAGLHLVLGLPSHVDDSNLAEKALRAGVTTRPLSMWYLRPSKVNRGLLLGYAAVPEAEIPKSFGVLARVMKRAL
jgi:GntR family transcriptional regulator/MocR family aminotransferase